ncbi:M20/M25/M40 family metallo-hydrolase [Nocardioides sp. CFH 31398]|uniref:M20/M25/M40 family metallo-hydrolase n=1 Tax=Nocardioides sp. CFH 31398 TaxID=2919579 RepID=UPI0027E0403E|nr:M20/M25/M40 family metallo-hydrolase [Nocardioides sp. CFH 31398]
MSSTRRRRLGAATVATAAGITLALSAATPTATAVVVSAPAKASGPSTTAATDSASMRKAITPRGLRSHLEALETLGARYDGRATTTRGYDAAARYVEFELREAGYKPRRDYFTYEASEILAESLTINGEGEPTDVPILAMAYTNSTPEGGVTGDLVAPNDTTGCSAVSWDGVEVTDQVALISRGTCSFADKARFAGEAGAAGAVVYNNTEGDLNGTLGDAQIEGAAPVGGVTQEAGQQLLAAAEAGTPVTLDIRADYFEAESYNILAARNGDPENEILLGAHLDGVEGTTAVNDNGTGVAALLEVAKNMPKKSRNKVQFAFWGAEEVGLIGSTEYVNDLVEQEGRQLDNIATYLNFDMLGSPNHIIGVYDADESKFPASAPVTAGSIETEQMFRSYFRSQKQPVVDTEFSGRSDYQAFLQNGVAAGGLFTGADGVKTPYQVKLFGGTAGELYDPNYHTPTDNLENVAVGPLHTMADAVGHMAITLAKSTREIDSPNRAPERTVESGLAAEPRR